MFPLYSAQRSHPLSSAPPDVQQQILQLIPAIANAELEISYRFQSEDRRWTLVLDSKSLALTTHAYDRWHGFKERVELGIAALREEFAPVFFQRVGLRYIDLIRRDTLGLSDRPWSSLLADHIASELRCPGVEQSLIECHRRIQFTDLEADAIVLLQHGLMSIKGSDEPAYAIDFDFSVTGKTEVGVVGDVLDRFNKSAGRAFQWCISTELDAALEPISIGDGDEQTRDVGVA